MEPITDLATRGTIAEKVKVYESATRKIKKAYKMLEEAEKMLNEGFSFQDMEPNFDTLPNGRVLNVQDGLKDVLADIKRRAWRQFYNMLQIDRIMSHKRLEEIDKRLEDVKKLPPISLQAVYDIFQTMAQNVNEYAKESVKEVYDWLRPSDNQSLSRYKTNQKNAHFELGRKVIQGGLVNVGYPTGYKVSYYRDSRLIALDKVFHMLDGRALVNTSSYRSELVDLINGTQNTGENVVVSSYFKCKLYKNGNVHIEFLRMDLVKEFNKIMGGMNLNPGGL